MSNSSLVNVKVPAYNGNYSQGRSGRKIEMITLHHMAGILTAEQCGKIFQQTGRQASSNYGVGCDCKVALYVDEENTSWANANWDSNCKAVTVEISNCEIGGDYKVADDVLNKVIELVADIAKRNNLGKLVKGKNLTWHSMYCATACPGKYLLSKIDYIIEEANKLIDGEKPVTPINRKYKVGQKVRVSSYYASSTDPVSKAVLKNATGTITRVLDNECHNPYLLENGNIGWCNDGDIREVINEEKPQENKYKVGQIVVYSSCYHGNNDVPPNYIDCIKSYGAWQQRKIVAIVGGKNPYKLDNGLFVNDGDIREVK